jgi:hypothetical protein
MIPTIIKINNDYHIKIDLGSEYYIGIVNQDYFPYQIKENYYDIITKAISNFHYDDYDTLDRNKINNDISEQPIIISYLYNPTYEYTNIFVINFTFNNPFININETINIELKKQAKILEDYINERFESTNSKLNSIIDQSDKIQKLESEISELEKINKEILSELVSVNQKIGDDNALIFHLGEEIDELKKNIQKLMIFIDYESDEEIPTKSNKKSTKSK